MLAADREGPAFTGDDSDTAAEVKRYREAASQGCYNNENTPAADADTSQLFGAHVEHGLLQARLQQKNTP